MNARQYLYSERTHDHIDVQSGTRIIIEGHAAVPQTTLHLLSRYNSWNDYIMLVAK